MFSQAAGPMTGEAYHGSGIPTAKIFDVSWAVALEIGDYDSLLLP